MYIMKYLLLILLLASTGLAVAAEDPQQLVRETADRVLSEVSANKADLEAHPEKIYPLIQATVLPHFDFRRMTQSAVGRFWPRASETQQGELVNQFRELLVRTYATALLGYSDQNIEYLPLRNPDGAAVMVSTRISSSGAPAVPIDYRLRLDGEKWLVYDVVIDGVSLVTNYRSSFATQIQRGGVDGLIRTLAEKNARSAG